MLHVKRSPHQPLDSNFNTDIQTINACSKRMYFHQSDANKYAYIQFVCIFIVHFR